ncbi:sensor histidine kinase [Gracilibacillus massiliensis]|uniref:sensor histidine kinase n=1 Tax=Gracilibacillus massiliensis TaxID=1564956 RepID=UPI00071E1280|nr:sensor histidine kinase [Gracilibacillus massiliensis]
MNRKISFPSFFSKKSIVLHIFVSFAFINILMILIVGITMIRDSTNAIKEEALFFNYKIVEQASVGLNNMIDEVKQPLFILSRNRSVIQSIINHEDMDIGQQLIYKRNINQVSSSVSEYKPIIRDILILGENGYYYNLIGSKTIDWEFDFNELEWFQNALANKNTQIKSLGLHQQVYYLDEYREHDEYTISLSIPIHSYQRTVIGSVILNLELAMIQDFFNFNPYNRGELFLLDEDNTILAHSDNQLIGSAFALDDATTRSKEGLEYSEGKLNGEQSIVVSLPSSIQGWKLVHATNLNEITENTNQLSDKLLNILLISLVVNILVIFLISKQISKPFQHMLNDINNDLDENFNIPEREYKLYELNSIYNIYFNLMKKIKTLIRNNYLTEISLKESEIKSLHSQMNPHMIFNTLQLLQTEIVFGNKKEANQIILALSKSLRYGMNQTHQLVTLKEEIEYIKEYLYIINKKFQEPIKLAIDIDEELLTTKVLRLTLQPIIENTIKHGFNEDGGEIRIHTQKMQQSLNIIITDDGVGMKQTALDRMNKALSLSSIETQSIGIFNLNQRIKLEFGDLYGLSLESEEGKYMKVFIKIPLDNKGGVFNENIDS